MFVRAIVSSLAIQNRLPFYPKQRDVDGYMFLQNPHVEIKTQYLYGKEVELIIQQGTVIGIVSGGNISQPSRLKLDQARIAYAENVPLPEFTDA